MEFFSWLKDLVLGVRVKQEPLAVETHEEPSSAGRVPSRRSINRLNVKALITEQLTFAFMIPLVHQRGKTASIGDVRVAESASDEWRTQCICATLHERFPANGEQDAPLDSSFVPLEPIVLYFALCDTLTDRVEGEKASPFSTSAGKSYIHRRGVKPIGGYRLPIGIPLRQIGKTIVHANLQALAARLEGILRDVDWNVGSVEFIQVFTAKNNLSVRNPLTSPAYSQELSCETGTTLAWTLVPAQKPRVNDKQ